MSGEQTTEQMLKSAQERKHLLIGSRMTLKALKNGYAEAVIYASNCPGQTKDDIIRNGKVGNVKCIQFNGTAKQLGVFLGKPFQVAAIAIKKG